MQTKKNRGALLLFGAIFFGILLQGFSGSSFRLASASFLDRSLASLLAGSSHIYAEDLTSYRSILSLSQNGRPLLQDWQFLQTKTIDSGVAIENLLLFRDIAGKHYYLRKTGIERKEFLPGRFYTVEVQFKAITLGGLPITEASDREKILVSQDKPYEGDIRESDPRVVEIKSRIESGQPAPQSIRLRYSHPEGDFLAFYDLDGKVIYYKYREDRFDDRGEKILRGLIKGQAYLVKGSFLGVIHSGNFSQLGTESYAKDMKESSSILVYQFQSVEPLRLEQILF